MATQLTEQEKELILKVASLIEQGSDGKQQITGHYFSVDAHKREDGVGCCAMGALYRGVGIDSASQLTTMSVLDKLNAHSWPRIQYPKSDIAPFAANEELNQASLPDVIIFMNDRLGWSFTKIVEWLRDSTLQTPTIVPLAPQGKPRKGGKLPSQGKKPKNG